LEEKRVTTIDMAFFSSVDGAMASDDGRAAHGE
jgi:hypothetical protein